MKTALALQHIGFEDLGTLEPLLRARGYDIRYIEAPRADLADIDPGAPALLVVLGGPLGAFDEAIYPFLTGELRVIERRLAAGRPMLGICLGAQLMARALGAKVTPMGRKEIGFGPLGLTPEGRTSALAPLDGVSVLHWHGDRFDLPAGAELLASTDICAEQAFAMGDAALGLQFHLEADAARIEQWLVGHCCELGGAGIDPRRVREQANQHGAALAQAAERAMGDWLDLLDRAA